jgi:dihydroorotase
VEFHIQAVKALRNKFLIQSVLLLASCVTAANAQHYDLIVQHGHVIDPKNGIDGVADVAVLDGKIAKVAKSIAASEAVKAVDATGLYVTPGLIDIHAHVYAGTGERNSYAGDNSLYPDGYTFRVGVTTVVDAGSSGWRSFEDFKDRVIDRSHTRILAMLNIVGAGMRGPKYEQNLDDMDGEATAKMAVKYPGLIVGIKSAHFEGPEWKPYEQAVIAGNIAKVPVMIDYGSNRKERPLYDLLSKVLRPGDIYTHMYSGLRGEQDATTGKTSEALKIGRKRGIYFDVGHGGGSFNWTVAVPLVKEGFIPDSISTDIHITSMNAGMKDQLNVASKMMTLGLSLQEVVKEMTSNPAKEIQHPELGNLTEGSPADITVLRLETGKFGFVDMNNTVYPGTKKLACELTVHDGKVVYDLNGLSADPWNGKVVTPAQAKRFTTMHVRPEKPSVAH